MYQVNEFVNAIIVISITSNIFADMLKKIPGKFEVLPDSTIRWRFHGCSNGKWIDEIHEWAKTQDDRTFKMCFHFLSSGMTETWGVMNSKYAPVNAESAPLSMFERNAIMNAWLNECSD